MDTKKNGFCCLLISAREIGSGRILLPVFVGLNRHRPHNFCRTAEAINNRLSLVLKTGTRNYTWA